MLAISKNTKQAAREVLRKVPVPTSLPQWDRKGRPENSFWQPVNHGELADTVIDTVQGIGLEIMQETWTLCLPNDAGLIGAIKVRTPNPHVAEEAKFDSDKLEARGMETTILVRHSNNAKWALQFLSGASIMVCTNGCIWGEFGSLRIHKKHSSKVDIKEYVSDSIYAVCQNFNGLAQMQDKMVELDLSAREGDHLILEAARKNVFPWQMVRKVAEEWQDPRHPEFKDRNGWSLYNAVTEIVKERSPADQVKSIGNMAAHLIGYARSKGVDFSNGFDQGNGEESSPEHEIVVQRGEGMFRV